MATLKCMKPCCMYRLLLAIKEAITNNSISNTLHRLTASLRYSCFKIVTSIEMHLANSRFQDKR